MFSNGLGKGSLRGDSVPGPWDSRSMMPRRLAWSLSRRSGESAEKADRLGCSLSQAFKDTLGSQGKFCQGPDM